MEEEIELTDLFSVLWQKKKIIIIITIILAVLALIGSLIIENISINQTEEELPKLYYAQTTFLVATSQTTTTTINQNVTDSIPVNITENSKNSIDSTIINTYEEIVKSQTVLNTVKEKLNLVDDFYDLYDSILVSRVWGSNLIAINVAYSNEQQAIQIADELMNEFIKNMSQTYFIDNVSIVDKAYTLSDTDIAHMFKEYIISIEKSNGELTNMLIDLKISKLISNEKLQNIFEEYIFKDEEIEKLDVTGSLKKLLKIPSSNIIKYTICSAGLGFIASVGIILTIDIFNKTIKNENNIKDNTLATIEYNGSKNMFDILRIKLESSKSILINNLENNNKNSYITNNLAIAFANMQKKTLLIDLTSNSTTLTEKVNEKGLFDFIKDKSKKIDSYISKSTTNNLDILLSGAESDFCLKESELKDMLANLEKNYDYIIINSNNISENANSLQIAKIIKNTISVAIQGKTKLNNYNKSKETILEIDGNILGTILLK